ncbi:AAA family ATPase [Corynebacterium massiliense]|uniref:AAA+ ATPase domain-containing protein n=1 Tax=Corynebacterium massiliense DSM 45435 TaxID=1121364 RepID=A0ABY7U6T8_9CORY|nr:AAA family ATPase [Corynebacterium massiliense]WCZ32422.1 hypothetical protein CMASS_04875 [Corynebacterium massiliense DSM 45435]
MLTKNIVPSGEGNNNAHTMNSFELVVSRAEESGLNVRVTEAGKQASIQTPGHSGRDLGTSISYNEARQCTLVHVHNEPTGATEEFLRHIGLELKDLYDNTYSDRYDYSDGFRVIRGRGKKFSQKCPHGSVPSRCTHGCKATIRSLYGVDSLTAPGAVYVVEGEKDVKEIRRNWRSAAVSQAGGSNNDPSKADWSPLKGRDVVIIADNDKPGHKRAQSLSIYLQGLGLDRPESIRVTTAAGAANDAAEHILAGYSPDDLEELEPKIGRRRVRLVAASTVKTESVDWLIDQWIPRGMLTLLAGREGVGKSTIACSWVAQFSRQGMKCAYLNSEDSRSYTVRPRLEAAGANLDNVFFIDVDTETGREGQLRLPADTDLLFNELSSEGVEFVVLDAAKSAMDPRLDGYRDDDIRQFLEPLAANADKHGITILGLAHFGKREGKDTGRLMLGSIAWSQIARSVLSAAVDEDEGRLIVTNTKSNLARGKVSREARLVSHPLVLDDGTKTELGTIQWGEFTDTAATDFLDSTIANNEDDRTEAEAWLEDYLTLHGPSTRAAVFKAAAREKIASERTIKRAFKKLGGTSEQAGFPRQATWSLPSRDSEATKRPRACQSGPTGPTGNDQQKLIGPTVAESQLGHVLKSGPTENQTTSRAATTDVRNLVLNCLSPDNGMTIKTLKGCFTKKDLAQIGDIGTVLNALTDEGLVTRDGKGKFSRSQAAA